MTPSKQIQLFICTILLLISIPGCVTRVNDKATASDSTANIEASNKFDLELSSLDSAKINTIIEDLSLIEQFAVGSDYELLSSLLTYKGDSLGAELEEKLHKLRGGFQRFEINSLDIKNGYISFNNYVKESNVTLTYWNTAYQGKLVAKEIEYCDGECHSQISFQRFKDGILQNEENDKVIPKASELENLLLSGYSQDGEPYSTKYILPQNSKNILFCLDNSCIELKWNGEIFEISPERISRD